MLTEIAVPRGRNWYKLTAIIQVQEATPGKQYRPITFDPSKWDHYCSMQWLVGNILSATCPQELSPDIVTAWKHAIQWYAQEWLREEPTSTAECAYHVALGRLGLPRAPFDPPVSTELIARIGTRAATRRDSEIARLACTRPLMSYFH